MNRFLIILLFISLTLPWAGLSQGIKELVPWSNAPDNARMGMAAQDLNNLLPNIAPLIGISDSEASNAPKLAKDGLYAPDAQGSDYSETTVYGIANGHVTQFYWSSTKRISLIEVEKLWTTLAKIHGKSRPGYKARVTKDGIAKITTEVFSVKNTDLAISISSALGVTEIAVLDTSDPNVNLNELYFSFEKQQARLRAELLRLTQIEPKEESGSSSLDILKEVIAIQSKKASEDHYTEKSSPPQTAEHPQAKEIANKKADKNISSDGESISVVFVVVSTIIIACIMVLISRAKRTGI